MDQIKIIAGVIIMGIIIGFGIAYFSIDTTSQDIAVQKSQSNEKEIPFSDFVKQQGTYKCTVSRLIEPSLKNSARLNGLAYIGKSMIRVDYPNALSLIFKNGVTYWWWVKGNPNYEMGVSANYLQESTTGTYSWKAEDIIEYDCEEWRFDSSKFEFPSDLKRYEQVPAIPVVKTVPTI